MAKILENALELKIAGVVRPVKMRQMQISNLCLYFKQLIIC